jgi:hypothetical protein
MGRPVGVTILAILNFIGAAFCLLAGIVTILGGGFIATMLSQQGSGASGILAGLGAAAGVFIIICGGLGGLVGFGLWKLKEWARIVSIVLVGINGAFQLLGLLGSLARFNALLLSERILDCRRRLYHLVPAQAGSQSRLSTASDCQHRFRLSIHYVPTSWVVLPAAHCF